MSVVGATSDEMLVLVVLAFIVAFALAFAIGANDVANSFGTSVGSKVISLRQACLLAAIFEILGALLLGQKVFDAVSRQVVDIRLYNGTEQALIMGEASALGGSCLWMLAATFLRVPVSATHSIVGATIGFSLVVKGFDGIQWARVGFFGMSWLTSPLLAGLVSCTLFALMRTVVLRKSETLEPGLRVLPLVYAITFFINSVSVLVDGSEALGFNQIPTWGALSLSLGLSGVVGVAVYFWVVPWQRERIVRRARVARMLRQAYEERESAHRAEAARQLADESGASGCGSNDSLNWSRLVIGSAAHSSNRDYHDSQRATDVVQSRARRIRRIQSVSGSATEIRPRGGLFHAFVGFYRKPPCAGGCNGKEEDRELRAASDLEESDETRELFAFLQILTASFAAFAHGANDVSNAVGPLAVIWLTYERGQIAVSEPLPLWFLVVGGVAMALGVSSLGRNVIKTIGEDVTPLTPTTGFCAELGTALTVLIASRIGIPVSTTHCIVGSVVSLGWFRAREQVDWRLLRNILFAWLATIPLSMLASAAMMLLMRFALPNVAA